ncbi:TonB-dependent receptor [Marivirga sp. S37H4]|uniref:TonB-dependent receptor n=1 Tax=Marivirga aurantiaca TaxID=2802615 RepID=A0A934X0U2_9BACT|nr:carboxypeptidase regulatory-like domain-containing protein [Marivirga aurantiaca]MBK6266599.1 TonB-dependent receptor [Marivirga aurantiaca]
MKRNLQKIYGLTIVLMLSAGWAFAQGVTTGGFSGKVYDETGEILPGANVIAEHVPSGTKYGAVTNMDGRFIIPNVRVGSPYTLTVSFIGYATKSITDLNVGLGQSTTINIEMSSDIEQLGEVVIKGERNPIFDADRTGATTNLDNKQINALPTINRDINDFTRLTPQSNGTSFAGRDNRFNNYTIDGNIYNNNFGLGSSQFAGGSPISLDVIEQVQVNLAPFDVRQSGFTGANVNAITKSGSNQFEGSVYYYLRNDQLIGDKVGETRLNVSDSENQIRGIRLGGPIIKDKLFFFVSYEQEEEFIPGFNREASRPGKQPDGLTVSRVPAERLDFIRSSLIDLYDYDPGQYENYPFASETQRLNARIDWNINRDHKLSVRFNQYSAFNDVRINGNSIRFIDERFRNTSRQGIEAMTFSNSNYTNDREITSWVGELNSKLSDKLFNNLNIGYTSVTDPKRGIPGGQAFPFIEVLEEDESGNDLYYTAVGNELYSVGNLLENNTLNITNNVSYFMVDHTITGGVNLEYMTFDNAFNPAWNGFYRYGSYDDFVGAVIDRDPTIQPLAWAQSFAYDGSTTPPTDQTRFGQLGLYVQDEFQVSNDFKLTYGVRVDLPFYPIDLPRNETLDALNKEYTDINGETFTPDVSTLPKVKPLWSPRVGFNWDVFGNKTTQLRGGTGVFSGRIPFVWLSNQVNGNGVIRGGIGLDRSRLLNPGDEGYENDFDNDPRPFSPNVNEYRPDGTSAQAQLGSELNITDEDFKLPQTWRTNLAVDQKLPFGIVGTLEFIYNRDISTPIAYNPVLRDPDGTLNGPDQRPYWDGSYSNDPDFRNVFQLTNANKQGDYYSATIQLRKSFESGLNTSLAYTRSRARDYGLEGGSQAISLWSATVQEDRNDPEISYTRFDQPNRVVGFISYAMKNTTLSIFYNGGEAGRFSYTYSGNFGDNSARLLYVPNDASELNFQEFTSDGVTYTAADQAAALDQYIDQDPYLSSIRGQVSERNGAKLPWVSSFDFRLAQDIPLADKNKLQLTFDILNVGNLLNSEWGVPDVSFQNNLLNYRGRDASNEPIYRANFVSGTTDFPIESYRFSTSLANTWRGQIGIRYIFGG